MHHGHQRLQLRTQTLHLLRRGRLRQSCQAVHVRETRRVEQRRRVSRLRRFAHTPNGRGRDVSTASGRAVRPPAIRHRRWGGRRRRRQLRLHQRPEPRAWLIQLLKRTLLGNAAIFQQHDGISRTHGTEAVRNDPHGRAALVDNRRDRLVDQQLRRRVQRRRRLVQQQDTRLTHQRTCNRNALPLSATQLTRPNHRVKALRQRPHKLEAVRRTSRSLNLLTRRMRRAVANVERDRALEQHRLLRHDAHDGTQRFRRVRANIAAIHHNASRVRLVETQQQRMHRRLACARAANKSDTRAWLDVEAHAIQHRLFRTARVPEVDVVKLDTSATAIHARHVQLHTLAQRDPRLLIQQAKHTRTRTDALHQRREKVRHEDQTATQIRRVHQQRRQITHRQLSQTHEMTAVREQRHDRTVPHKAQTRVENTARVRLLGLQRGNLLNTSVKALFLRALRARRRNRTERRRRQALLSRACHHTHGILRLVRQITQESTVIGGAQRGRRNHKHHDERELRRYVKHGRARRQDRHRRAQTIR